MLLDITVDGDRHTVRSGEDTVLDCGCRITIPPGEAGPVIGLCRSHGLGESATVLDLTQWDTIIERR